jgi:hypothetical protein
VKLGWVSARVFTFVDRFPSLLGAHVGCRRALEKAAGEGSPSDAAWVMRRAFDSILGG